MAVSGDLYRLKISLGTTATPMAAVLTGFILTSSRRFVKEDEAAFCVKGI